jgi:hydroxyacylglutathione hydrolase
MIAEMRSFGPIATNSLLLVNPNGKTAYIFDAPQGSCHYWKQRAAKDSFTIAGLFLTHSHWDHIADAAAIKKEFNTDLWIHEEDAGNLRQPGSDGLPLHFPIDKVEPDNLLEDGQKIQLDGFFLIVLHTPGHSLGSVCFYSPENQLLVSGDTLFRESIGRLDLPTGCPGLMKNSLEKLIQLPGETRVYPGHGELTTIANENSMMHYLCQEEL